MATKLYPIGMQTFSEIREEDFLYVDGVHLSYDSYEWKVFLLESSTSFRKVTPRLYYAELFRGKEGTL